MADPITEQQLIDAATDAETLEQFVSGDKNTDVTSRLGRSYATLAKMARMTQMAGGLVGFATKTELLAYTPASGSRQLARVYGDGTTANNGDYYWNGTAWVKSGYDPVTLAATAETNAKGYADANGMFNPTVNTVTNLNNANYGVAYINQTGTVTVANNFPVASTPTYVLTYATSGSSVKYQRAILPFANPIRVFDRSYTGSWSAWSEGTNKAAVDALTAVVNNNTATEQAFEAKVFSTSGKNLLDKSKIVAGEFFSPGSNAILASASYRRSGFIPVVAGTTYTKSGNYGGNDIAWYATADKLATPVGKTATATATAPTGANFAVINITGGGSSDTTYDGTTQFEAGSVATVYEAYKPLIAATDIKGTALTKPDLIESYSFNMIDPAKVNFAKRYSTGNKTIINADSNLIAMSDWIPVKEGQFYALNGGGFYNPSAPQGGYFSAYGATTAVDNITWASPPTGGGKIFQVPIGSGITHVVISLATNAGHTALADNVQMERGEVATAYQAYQVKDLIKSELLPAAPATTASGALATDWYKYVAADGARLHPDKLPNFRAVMLTKSKDLNIVMTGTSLTARTIEHCSDHPNANTRPPMMHSKAMCSHLWDVLAQQWPGQQYRRYDATGAFTESGTWATSSSLAEWDDGAYRSGLTRYSETSSASVAFTVPVDAWAARFIYRTDSVGCTATVTIGGGNGLMQVWSGSAWVEANGYTFSQAESAPVTRAVAVPDPVTGTTTSTTLASKGNTTYQKRLFMRCRNDDGTLDSRSSAKTVTIARSGGGVRLMYWGVEWSPRQYMVTLVNSARGSHKTDAANAQGLPRFQDNEVWGFAPDLILSELAIHNDGAASESAYAVGRWAGLAHNYVTNTGYELSLYARAAALGYNPEYAFFMGSITWGFNGIDDAGQLKWALQPASVKGAAKVMTALDKYKEAVQEMNSRNVVCIDSAQRWVNAATAMYGDLKTATLGSGKNGTTLTNEGSHWNDNGAAVMAKVIAPLLRN